MHRRAYLTTLSATVCGVVLAGCSGLSGGGSGEDAKATIRTYLTAICSKDADTVNELQSKYGIEDTATKSDLYDADCSVSNIEEQPLPDGTDEDRFLEKDAISEVRYYSFTYTFNGDKQRVTIMLALQDDGWKVLDIG